MPFFTISFDSKAFRQYLAQFDDYEINRRANAAMAESLAYLQNEVVKNTPSNFGLLRNSIQPSIHGTTLADLRGTLAPTGPSTHYAYYVEEGRRPGKFPPRAPIELWAQRKLGDAGLWFVVARKIARRGIEGKHMFRDAKDRGQKIIPAIWRRHFKFK